MADGEWHTVELNMENYIIFTVDNKTFVEEQCHNEFEYEDIDLYVGEYFDVILFYNLSYTIQISVATIM